MPYFQNQRKNGTFRYVCDFCNTQGWRSTKQLSKMRNDNYITCFCSTKCQGKYFTKINTKILKCSQCDCSFSRNNASINDKRNKSKNNFCSKSCAATYNNSHKTTGARVSKLQKWLWRKLYQLYPCLPFQFNGTSAINAELDIYCPSLKLAFQLNGIFHYQPIYGKEQLQKTKYRDSNKFLQCHKNDIGLCVIDTSKQKYFKQSTCLPFLTIITDIIDSKYERQQYQKQVNRDINDQLSKSKCGSIYKPCTCCNKLFLPCKKSQITCSTKCGRSTIIPKKRPSKQDIQKNSMMMNRNQLAKFYNSSTVSIWKWKKFYGIK